MNSIIHPSTSIGLVHLIVSDLNRSLNYYKDVIGFQLLRQEGRIAELTMDGIHPIVVLEELTNALPKQRQATGLYHFAILVPERKHLATFIMNLIQRKKQLDGASDHWVSEALYLSDPDDNGIEVYVDRPSDTWRRDSEGAPLMATEALDLQALLDAHSNEVWSGLPTGTTIGHIHLHVADLKKAQAFYCDVLGFELIASYGSQALFVSAGGYHHHIGLNVWAGVGVPPQSAHSVGLKHYEIVIPDLNELTKLVDRLAAAGIQMQQQNGHLFVQDPSGNSIVFVIKK